MLGQNQIFILEYLYDKPDTVAGIALAAHISFDDMDDFDGEHRRQWRFVTRRALVGMEKRGLVEKVGMAESVTEPMIHGESALLWAGRRVPKGYTRQSVQWRITPKGKTTLDDIRAFRPSHTPTPEQAAESERIGQELKALFAKF